MTDRERLPADQMPPGFDPAQPAIPDRGIREEEVVPGVGSLRMDPLLLLRDGRGMQPPKVTSLEVV
jgi:hypothetical protein